MPRAGRVLPLLLLLLASGLHARAFRYPWDSLMEAIALAREQRSLPEPERAALRALYAATGGDGWRHRDNWSPQGDPCRDRFYGVACGRDRTTGRPTVVDIYLGSNNLVGQLPPLLAVPESSAERLRAIAKIRATLPADVVDAAIAPFLRQRLAPALPNLRSFTAAQNHLSGPIPSGLVRAPKLHYLNLAFNELTGTLPDFEQTPALLTLLLIGNNFTNPERWRLAPRFPHAVEYRSRHER